MNKKLYNIIWLLALSVVACLGFTACDEDDDDNPVLDLSHVSEGFVLNTPANAANNTYDLANSETIELTCSQPNYGTHDGAIIPYAVRYYVQISLSDSSFSSEDSYSQLSTSYTTADMFVDASEMNTAVAELYMAANPNEDFTSVTCPLYVRLRAVLDNADGLGETYSNSITLPSVLSTYKAPDAEYPEAIYFCGADIQEYWSSWKECAPVYGIDGAYYTVIYCDDAENYGEFKWGTYVQQWAGYSDFASITNETASATISNANENIKIDTAGWYTLLVNCTLSGSSATYDLTVYDAEAYVIGAAFDSGNWTEDAAKMTAPSDATGLWESPEADGSGELRAYVKIAALGSNSWWRTEYTLYNGELYWRTVDIPNNWATDLGDDYSVQVSAGQKLYVDFNYNTGKVE